MPRTAESYGSEAREDVDHREHYRLADPEAEERLERCERAWEATAERFQEAESKGDHVNGGVKAGRVGGRLLRICD